MADFAWAVRLVASQTVPLGKVGRIMLINITLEKAVDADYQKNPSPWNRVG